MSARSGYAGIFIAFLGLLFFCGCVERRLTILTQPSDAVITLNDEEIGESPVTVNFNWYGDYKVRIHKDGYETIDTHRELERPWYDVFPFDFFAQVVDPRHHVDNYTWNFELEERKSVDREKLIESGKALAEKAKADYPIEEK